MSKAVVARILAKRVSSGDVIGLGSGSTAELAILEIGKRISSEGISVAGVPTSIQTARIAHQAGIQVLSAHTDVELSWAFDGADEIDQDFNMIKGRGAAMLTEKLIARRLEERLIIIISEDKLVNKLGEKFAVPVEIVPEALPYVPAQLKAIGANEILLRESNSKYGPTITEHNNLIFDVRFDSISPDLEAKIKNIVGVVESGLFIGATKEVLISKGAEVWRVTLENNKRKEVRVDQ